MLKGVLGFIIGLIGVVFFSYYLYDKLVVLPHEEIDRRYCSDPWYAAFPDRSKDCSKFVAEHKDNVTWMQQYEKERIYWADLCQRQTC